MIEATAAVRSVRTVGSQTIALDIETPATFAPKPGQFVKLTAFVDGEHVSRFYTLSSPVVADTFELTVGIDDEEGTLAPWLHDAAGEEVVIEGPYGRAYYDGEPVILVLAGGPGIGAAVGIGEAAEADGHNAAIVYRGEEPAHTDRLAALDRAGIDVEIVEQLDEAVAEYLQPETTVFVFGFQSFVTDALAAIEAAGGSPDDAKVENFG